MKNEKQNIKRELEELNSILKDMPDDGGLNFPIGYFEELENDILNKTIYAEKDINNNKKIIRLTWLKYVSGIAAVFVLVFIGVKIFGNKNDGLEMQLANMNNTEIDNFINKQIASISSEELQNYLIQNVEDIDTELLFETDFISDATVTEKMSEDVNEQIMQETSSPQKNENLLDEELLKQLDDQTIQDYLNDAALFEDLGI